MLSTITMRVCSRLLEESNRSLEIHVFDFDDTLVRTNSKIKVEHNDGEVTFLSPREYAKYRREPGDVFDYSEFEEVIEPELVTSTFLRLKRAVKELGSDNVFILTARGNPEPVAEYLDSVGVSGVRVFAVGTSDPAAKANVIKDEVISKNIKRVYFYDDAMKNIEAVKKLRKILSGVSIITMRMK